MNLNAVSFIILYFLGFLVLMYFLMIHPGKKKNRKMQELHKSVKSGDKVITVSGLYGTVKEKVGEDVLLVIDEENDVTVKVVIYAIQSIITASGSKE